MTLLRNAGKQLATAWPQQTSILLLAIIISYVQRPVGLEL